MEFNRIYNMDCVEGLSMMEDSCVDLIVTSPPYNVGIDYDSWEDNMEYTEYLSWCEEWLSHCYRVLKDDGRICVNHCFVTHNGDLPRFPIFDLKVLMEKVGFRVMTVSMWDDVTIPSKTAWGSWMSASCPNIMQPYEGILIACKSDWKKHSKGESTISRDDFIEGCYGIWKIGTVSSATKANFPERLPQMCIDLLSFKGDVVLDPFSGSGTTCYVAKVTGRKYIGFEISSNYYSYSLARLNGSSQFASVIPTKRDESFAEYKKVELI